MARYIEFATEDGDKLLVEVDESEVSPATGVEKAGLLGRRPAGSVAEAAATFEAAVERAVRRNVLAVSDAVKGLPSKPDEVELAFGLKATGEVGNIALAKVSGEATLNVKLNWKISGPGAEREPPPAPTG